MDGIDFAVKYRNCHLVNNISLHLKQNGDNCTDPCYFEANCVGSFCQHDAINFTVRNFEVVFKMDRISMVHSRVFCQGSPSSNVRMYDIKLVCNKTFVKENSEIGSLCFQDSHCSSDQHLNCYTYKRNWETSPYGFCKCRTGYVEHNRTCLQENLALHSPCEISSQCQDHRFSTACFHQTDGFKRCLCKSNLLEDNKKCIEGNLTLHSKCQSDIQCLDQSSTECREGPRGRNCLCKPKYLEYEDKCLKSEVRVNQTCTHEVQCNGTLNAPVCYRHRCSCEFGYFQSDDKCIKGSATTTYGVFYLVIAVGSGLIIGILLSVSAMILNKWTWTREGKLNTVSNVMCRTSNVSIPCANREIYNSIDEFPYAEPKDNTERQEEKQQRLCSVEAQYNHLAVDSQDTPAL